MRIYGFDIVAIWDAVTTDRTEFVYLLAWPDETVKRAAWERFMADEEWKETKRATSALRFKMIPNKLSCHSSLGELVSSHLVSTARGVLRRTAPERAREGHNLGTIGGCPGPC